MDSLGGILETSSDRPRLLFLCQYNPWRLNAGGIIRNYWLVHALAQRFDVDLVTGDDVDGPIPPDFAEQCASINCFPRPKGFRAKLTRARGALRFGSSYFTSGNVTPPMRAYVSQLLKTRQYSVLVTELGMIDAVPDNSNVALVYSSHNCEAALLLRRAKFEPLWSRIAMTIDALRVRRLEARFVERATIATVCSPNDVEDMTSSVPSIADKAVVIPNGVDCATYSSVAAVKGNRGVILVTGSFDWLPNRRGLLWFIKEVLPIVDKMLSGTNYSVRIAGRMSAEFAKKLNTIAKVTAVPNVPRMEVELRGASVVAVPVIASSGTRLRILEAWAAGRPVVTTPHGAFGLQHTDESDILVRSSPQLFAEATVKLLNNEILQSTLRAGGLTRAASYDWSVIGSTLIGAFERFGLLQAAVPEVRSVSAGS